MRNTLVVYVSTFLVFLALDAAWLSTMGRSFYFPAMSGLLLERPRLLVALGFYALYIVGVVFFVSLNADGAVMKAALHGALFGLIAYATYDLTNLSTLRGFPVSVALVDMAWGAVVTAASASAGLAIASLFRSA